MTVKKKHCTQRDSRIFHDHQTTQRLHVTRDVSLLVRQNPRTPSHFVMFFTVSCVRDETRVYVLLKGREPATERDTRAVFAALRSVARAQLRGEDFSTVVVIANKFAQTLIDSRRSLVLRPQQSAAFL